MSSAGSFLIRESLPRTERTASLAAVLLLASLAAFCLHFALQPDVRHLLVRVVDDASYYFCIARNIADGHGMTFDGFHPTNGFHPLWLITILPFFKLSHSPETMLRIIVLLQTALLSAAFVVLYRTQSRLFSRHTALAGGVLFAYLVCLQSLNGMESALFVLLLVSLYACGLHLFRSRLTLAGGLGFGLLLGLMLLSRLDMVFVPLALLLCYAPRILDLQTPPRAIGALIVGGLGCCLIVVPYLLFNHAQFGAFMPISGALKSSFPTVALSHSTITGISNRNYVFVACALGWLAWRVIATRNPFVRRSDGYYAASTTVLAWAILLHFADTILFMKWAVFEWHFILYPLFAVILLAGLIDRLLSSTLMARTHAVYWVVVLGMFAYAGWKENGRNALPPDQIWHTAAFDAAIWAREHTPPTAVFAMSDAGHFAFFSERHVVNLDGLVNDMSLQQAMRERRINAYLLENHVDFLVQHALRNRDDVIRGAYDSLALSYVSHKYDVAADDVIVHRFDEVYRSRQYFDGTDPAVFLIWSRPDAAHVQLSKSALHARAGS